MKRAIIIKGQSDSGKTTLLNKIYSWIKTDFKPTSILSFPLENDLYEIFSVRDLIVGFCSRGDNGDEVQQFIDDCLERNCDLIIGVCRGKGSTYDVVREKLTKPAFVIDYVNTFHVDADKRDEFASSWFDEAMTLIIGLN